MRFHVMKQKYFIVWLMREAKSIEQHLASLKSKFNIPSLGISNRLLATKVCPTSKEHMSNTHKVLVS